LAEVCGKKKVKQFDIGRMPDAWRVQRGHDRTQTEKRMDMHGEGNSFSMEEGSFFEGTAGGQEKSDLGA